MLDLQYSSKHKENGDIFSVKPSKKERKIVSGNYCSNSAHFNCRRWPVLEQYDVKQRNELSEYEGIESAIFKAYSSYCCIPPSNWCCLSSLNFAPFINESAFSYSFLQCMSMVHVKQMTASSGRLAGASSHLGFH